MSSPIRRRPPLACEQCRRRKIRCDRKSPCSNCVRLHRPSCTYVPLDPKTIAVRYGQKIDLGPTPDSASSPSTSISNTDTDSANAESVKALMNRVRQLEHTLEEVLGVSECTLAPKDPTINGRFIKTRFFGNSHRSNICESKFYDLSLLFHRFKGDEGSDIQILHTKCKQLVRTIRSQTVVNQPPSSNFHEMVPPKPVADRLVHAYFRTFESVYRIMHRPSFYRWYAQYWVNPKSSSPDFTISLLLIMSIGSTFEENQISRPSVARWICAAQAWLTSASNREHLNFESLQVHCLLLLARQVTAIGSDLVWVSSGSLLHSAMHFGLHLNPHHIVEPSPFHSELRRRLWATILELLLQASMDAGGVPLISPEDYDCDPPCNLDDGHIELDIQPPSGRETFTETSVQIALLRSFPVRLQIARAINTFRDRPSYKETIRLSAELSDIYRKTAFLFDTAQQNENTQPTPFQTKLYDFMTQRFFLALHDSYSTQVKSNPKWAFSRQLTLKTSLRILGLSECPEDSRDFTSLLLAGAASFRDVPMQAAAIVCDELLSRIEKDNLIILSSTGPGRYQNLRTPLELFLSSTLARLQIGETSIQSFLTFSAILVQADAMQEGRNAKESVKEAFRQSLATCVDIFQAVAGDISNDINRDTLVDDIFNGFQGNGLLNDDFPENVYTWIQGYS